MTSFDFVGPFPSGSLLPKQLGREIALHPVGEDSNDVDLGPQTFGGHHGRAEIQARAGPDGEALANQGSRDLERLVVEMSSSTKAVDSARKAS